MDALGWGGLALSGLGAAGQMWSNWQNQQYTQEMQKRYEGILGGSFGATEGYLGQGYEEGMAGLQGAYGPYAAGGRALGDQALRASGQSYDFLLNRLRGDEAGSMAGWQGREGDIVGGYGARTGDIGGGYGARTGDIGGGYGARTGDIGGRYGERLSTAMGMMEGLGTQQRADLRRDYGERGASQQAGLAARGMGGTTIGANLAQGNLREQGYASNRLEDMLTRERMDVYGQMTAEELMARERMTGEGLLARERMTGEGLLARERMTGEGLLAGERTSADTLGMGDYWRKVRTQAGAEQMFAAADIQQATGARELDIGFQQGMDEQAMGQGYYGNMANLQLKYPEMWGNFMTQNPVEFTDFSPMINYGSQVTSYSQMLQQQREAEAAEGGGFNLLGAGVGGAAGWYGGTLAGMAVGMPWLGAVGGAVGGAYMGSRM